MGIRIGIHGLAGHWDGVIWADGHGCFKSVFGCESSPCCTFFDKIIEETSIRELHSIKNFIYIMRTPVRRAKSVTGCIGAFNNNLAEIQDEIGRKTYLGTQVEEILLWRRLSHCLSPLLKKSGFEF